MAMFDYDSLMKDATYVGTYLRDPENPENKEVNPSYMGKFLGMSADQLLKIASDPDGKCRQVALLCNDEKYGQAWRLFEPETLVLAEG